ncbi:MAG: hypothetical protein ACLFU4_09605 [Opitutales bacterium]
MKWLQSTFANPSELKRHTSAPGTWIAEKLNMGAPQLVSTYVNRLRREIDQHPDPDYETFILKYTEWLSPFCP